MKTIILLSCVLASAFGFGHSVFAVGPSLNVVADSATYSIDTPFDVRVVVDPAGSSVCAVEGTLQFANAEFQRVTINPSLITSQSPTAENPSFLIGIPGCTKTEVTVLTLSLTSTTLGTGGAHLERVDILGEGVSLSSATTGVTFTVVAPPKEVTQPATIMIEGKEYPRSVLSPAQPTFTDGNGVEQPNFIRTPQSVSGVGEAQFREASTSVEDGDGIENVSLQTAALGTLAKVSTRTWLALVALLAIIGGAYYSFRTRKKA